MPSTTSMWNTYTLMLSSSWQGGLTGGKPAAWVAARLDVALKYDSQTDYYLVLSRGTTHKPPPLDSTGFPIDESFASAAYLLDKGVEQRRVLLESWSLDTIGNAAFARLMHADLRGWRRILVVTSASHMPRTRAIFEWVFSLPPGGAGAVVDGRGQCSSSWRYLTQICLMRSSSRADGKRRPLR